jgi:ANTAR domain
MLAERAQISVHRAFTEMRDFARRSNQKLVSVAQGVIEGDLAVAELSRRNLGEDVTEHPFPA